MQVACGPSHSVSGSKLPDQGFAPVGAKKMWKWIAMLAVMGLMSGCGSQTAQPAPKKASEPTQVSLSAEELASQTLSEMLAVASSGDFDKYVDAYYGESHKFGSPADRDALVQRFEGKWRDSLLDGLNRAAELPVKIDGERALFLDGDEPVFILHRSEDGAWKFHL